MSRLPRIKGEAVGLVVRSLRPLTRGDGISAPRGTLLVIARLSGRGGFELQAPSCVGCGVSFRITEVSPRSFEVVGRAVHPKFSRDVNGRRCGFGLPSDFRAQAAIRRFAEDERRALRAECPEGGRHEYRCPRAGDFVLQGVRMCKRCGTVELDGSEIRGQEVS